MKTLSWCLNACYIVGFCLFFYAIPSAGAQFPPSPKQRPASAPQATQTEVQAPAPTFIQATPPTVNVAAPNVSVSPQLVAPAPNSLDEIREWLKTTFLGLLTAIGGWIGFRGIKNAGTATGGQPAVVADVLAKLSDPAVKQSLEAHGLQIALAAVESGIPKSLIQGAVGLAPVGGTINAAYDATVGPLIHNLGIKALQDMITRQDAATQNFGRTP